MSSSLAKPGTAPTCWTYRSAQSVCFVQCSHSELTGLCRDGLVCWGCAGSTALPCTCCPGAHIFAGNPAPVHIPFPFSLHTGFIAQIQEMFCTRNALAVLGFLCSNPAECVYPLLPGDWRLRCSSPTRVCSDSCGDFLIWDLLAHHCLKLTPSSFKFSNKFSSLGLLFVIQVPKWWQHGYLLPSDLQEGSRYLAP